MSWKEGVQSRFSPREDADKWDRMYAQDTESLDDEFFRLRRDFTVAYVTEHYDTSAIICDLGCGAGPVISTLLNRGYDATGFDYSIDMLDNAARRIATSTAERRPLARCDIQALPLRNDSFDCAVCLGVISYVEHYENIIREIHRILKPGGTAIVSYRNEKNLMISDPVGPIKYLGKKMLEFLDLGPRKFRIGNHMSYAEVGRTLQRNGLTLEVFKGIGFGPLRFNRRTFLSDKTSLALHRTLTGWLDGWGAEFASRIGTDVHILVVRKSASG